MAKPPPGVELVYTDRIEAVCETCRFRGDSIYFNRLPETGELSKQCAFCEFPPRMRLIGAPMAARLFYGQYTRGSGDTVGRHIIATAELPDGPFKRLAMSIDATCTVMALDTGTVVLSLHTLRFVDDF